MRIQYTMKSGRIFIDDEKIFKTFKDLLKWFGESTDYIMFTSNSKIAFKTSEVESVEVVE